MIFLTVKMLENALGAVKNVMESRPPDSLLRAPLHPSNLSVLVQNKMSKFSVLESYLTRCMSIRRKTCACLNSQNGTISLTVEIALGAGDGAMEGRLPARLPRPPLHPWRAGRLGTMSKEGTIKKVLGTFN